MGKIKGLLIDVYRTGGVREVEFEDTLENIYELLDVDLIDVAELKVGGTWHDFVVDDEGLREGCFFSVYNDKGEPALAGNCLIVNHDDEGNFASLNEPQIEELKKHCGIVMYTIGDKTKLVHVLNGIEYERKE